MTTAQRLIPWIAPAAGAVFFTLWVVAEAGRQYEAGYYVWLAGYSIAIGIAAVLPRTALAIIAALPVAMLVGILPAFESTTWPIVIASLFVGFTVAITAKPLAAWVALGVGTLQAVLVAYIIVVPTVERPYMWESWRGIPEEFRNTSETVVTGALLAAALYALAWTAGFAVRLNLRRLRAWLLVRDADVELVQATEELRAASERREIAQEVHDVVAHSLAVTIMIADGARYLRPVDAAATDDAFREIADAARAALIDVKGLIEGLNDSTDAAKPGLADLDSIVRRIRAAGPEVTVLDVGARRVLTPARDLAVYRITQESLTNALRHAGANASIRVQFDWSGPGLLLTIASTGDAGSVAEAEGRPVLVAGNGLRGMAERARFAGGWLVAGWADGDEASSENAEFLVTVSLPFDVLPLAATSGERAEIAAVDTGAAELVGETR